MRTLLRIEEVAISCGVSVQTINNWYKFKSENPDNQYAQLLPNYITVGGRRQRLWDKADIPNLLKFKSSMPKGCKGVMGSVTQKYVTYTSKKEARDRKNAEKAHMRGDVK